MRRLCQFRQLQKLVRAAAESEESPVKAQPLRLDDFSRIRANVLSYRQSCFLATDANGLLFAIRRFCAVVHSTGVTLQSPRAIAGLGLFPTM